MKSGCHLNQASISHTRPKATRKTPIPLSRQAAKGNAAGTAVGVWVDDACGVMVDVAPLGESRMVAMEIAPLVVAVAPCIGTIASARNDYAVVPILYLCRLTCLWVTRCPAPPVRSKSGKPFALSCSWLHSLICPVTRLLHPSWY